MESDDYTELMAAQKQRIDYQITVKMPSDEMRKYPPRERGCYFQDERRLEYFYIYSENNCLFECITNSTIQMCECTAFYMPKVDSIPICGFAKAICIENATLLAKHEKCNCLPGCDEFSYHTTDVYTIIRHIIDRSRLYSGYVNYIFIIYFSF